MENQVLTKEELKVLQNIQTQTQSLVGELGEIDLIRLQLNNRHEVAKKTLEQITTSEQKFTQDILKKYGDVSLNPQTGELTKLEQN
jgi:hypothetical protein